MKKKAIQRLLKLQPYQPGRPISEVKRELGLRQVVKLASNENPYPPSPKVIEAITRAAQDLNRYPDGYCYELRRAVAEFLHVDRDDLIFGNGSDEIIIMAQRAFVEPGDEVIVSHPSFMVYSIGAQALGAVTRVIPMKDFRHDLAAITAAVTDRTKIIFIDNPGNPAGTYVPSDELKGFLDSVPSDVLVFLDEAYYEYAVERDDYPRTIPWLSQYPNLVVARTFSKMYGLAGLRVGYAAASAEVVDLLNRVREPFNVNSLAQVAAVAALRDRRYYEGIRREFLGERQRVCAALEEMGIPYVPSATNFVLMNVGAFGPGVADRLLGAGVIVRDMRAWGLEAYIRITIGSARENNKCLRALQTVVQKS